MSRLDYRVADIVDVMKITDLIETCFRSDLSRRGWTTEADLIGGARTTPDEIESHITHTAGAILVGETDGTLISCCRLQRLENNRVLLGMLCVHPLHQGGGLGRELLDFATSFAITHLNARTLTLLVLDSRFELRAWYEKIGFIETGARLALEEEMDPGLALVPGLEFVVYERQLSDSR